MVDPGRLRLYLVTDPVLCGERGVEETCRIALEAGVTAVQLRDKLASTREMIETGRNLSGLCRKHGVPFIVNDRVDVAMACDADGVHLGQEDMSVPLARTLMGNDRLIGVSVRSPGEAKAAWMQGAGYIAANMIFSTSTKTDLDGPLGLEAIRDIKDASPLPLVAIGGINAENAAEVVAAGADGIAVVSAIMAAEDVGDAVRRLLAVVD
jgi:thiamine-phosphate pyrophosphorylase